jgi:hypothetical protein
MICLHPFSPWHQLLQNFHPPIISLFRLVLPTLTSYSSPPGPPLILPWVLTIHPYLIPRALPALPETASLFPNQRMVTMDTIFRPIYLLSGAEPADHSIRMFIQVLLGRIVTSVAWVDLGAAAKSKPSVAFRVVLATTSAG